MTRAKFPARWLISILLLLLASLPLFSAAEETEKSILINFYESTMGDNWKDKTNWKTNEPICSWYGVTCELGSSDSDNDDQGITSIDLSHNNLNGKIPSDFWKLPHLKHLNLRNNLLTSASFDGLLTADATRDKRSPIELLTLSENHLTEMTGIGNAKETLQAINFNKNQLDTALPDELFDLTKLESLDIGFNQIPGTLPTKIGKLTQLTEFYAFHNRLTGTIPTEIGLLDVCQILGLGNNLLTGTLPSEINKMVNMGDLSIHHVITEDIASTNSIPQA
jgi:Leucine-rich repeat (LRR) protein